MQALAVERSSTEGVDVLSVGGEIDLATSPRLIAVLNEAVADAASPLVIDLSGVTFMDSTGIALLLNAHRRVRRRGLGFAVACPPGPLHRVFEISDMVETLHICPDRETAIAVAAQPLRRFI